MDASNPAIELDPNSAAEFAALVDYLRDYRDCASEFPEIQKLEIFTELQRHIDALYSAHVSLCYATRDTKLVGSDWPDKTPWPVRLVYLTAFHKGKAAPMMAVPKKVTL
jgi:hypothetical protein